MRGAGKVHLWAHVLLKSAAAAWVRPEGAGRASGPQAARSNTAPATCRPPWHCSGRGLVRQHPVGCKPNALTFLDVCAACPQVPIGLEEFHEGVVDIVSRRALRFEGAKGLEMQEGPVPDDLKDEMEQRRAELVERVSEVGLTQGRLTLSVLWCAVSQHSKHCACSMVSSV